MADGIIEPDTGRVLRSHTKARKQAGPDKPNCTRRHIATDNEDTPGHTREESRLQPTLKRRRRNTQKTGRAGSQPSRKSLPTTPLWSIQQNEELASGWTTTRENPTPVRVLKRGPLTEKNLRVHTESIMPRGRKAAAASPSACGPSRTTTTANKDFGIQLNKNKVFHDQINAVKPGDLDLVERYLNRRRESRSPDEETYDTYLEQVAYAENEQSMQCLAWPLLAKCLSRTPGYITNYNYQWTEVDGPLTNGISDAKPDISESFRIDQYPSETVEALGSALAPTQYRQAMPTFCAEWKGPNVALRPAEKQCAYDGALMVDAAYQVHKYMRKPSAEFFNKTQAITMALNGEVVQPYSNYMVKRGSTIEYHQRPLQGNMPGNSLEQFKETCRRVRNCQDWARERATRTKDELHAYVDAEPDAAQAPWVWSAEQNRHYRTLPDGTIVWATVAPSEPGSTQRITTTGPAQGRGKATRRGRGGKATGAKSRTKP